MGQKNKKRNGRGSGKAGTPASGEANTPSPADQASTSTAFVFRSTGHSPARSVESIPKKKMAEYRGGLLVNYVEPMLQKIVLTEFTDDVVTSTMRQKAMQVALESEDWQRALDHPKVTDFEFQDSYTLLPHTTVSQFHEEGGMILVCPRDESNSGLLELNKDLKTRVAGLEVEVETRKEMCSLREEMTSLREQMAKMATKVKTTEEKVSSLQHEIAKMKVDMAEEKAKRVSSLQEEIARHRRHEDFNLDHLP